jgi:hypothetical protein
MTDVSARVAHEPAAMVVVIELVERQPPIGTLGRENEAGVRFEGWLGLIGALTQLLDGEDQRLARAAAEAADRAARPSNADPPREEQK